MSGDKHHMVYGPQPDNHFQEGSYKDGNEMEAEITAEYSVPLGMKSKIMAASRQEEAGAKVGSKILEDGAMTRPIQKDENLRSVLEYPTPAWTPHGNTEASNVEGEKQLGYPPKRKFQRRSSIGHGGEDEPRRKKQNGETSNNWNHQIPAGSESHLQSFRCLLYTEDDPILIIDEEDRNQGFPLSRLFGRSALSETELLDWGEKPNDEPLVGPESSQSEYVPSHGLGPSLGSAGSKILSEEVVEMRKVVETVEKLETRQEKLEWRLEKLEESFSTQNCSIEVHEISGSHNIVGNGNIVCSQNRTEAPGILSFQQAMGPQYLPHHTQAHYDLQHGIPQAPVHYAQPKMGMDLEAVGFAKPLSPESMNMQQPANMPFSPPPTPIPQHYCTQWNSSSQTSSHQVPLSGNVSRAPALRPQEAARPTGNRDEDERCCRVWQFKTVKKSMDK